MVKVVICAALATLLSCGYSAKYCEVSCANDGPCPSGLSCIAGMCRGEGLAASCNATMDATNATDGSSVTDGPPGDAHDVDAGSGGSGGSGSNMDPDGDGFIGSADNCPTVANADQANEDNDDFGDACDPCPISTDNSDPDSDGVGGPCDPNPNTPGEKFAVPFQGFSSGIVPAGWTASGSWTNDGAGNLVSTNGTLLTPTPATHETITTKMTLVSVAATSDTSIGVLDDHAGGSGVECDVYAEYDASTGRHLGLLQVGGNGMRVGTAQTIGVNPGSVYTMSNVRNGESFSCSAGGESTGGSVSFSVASPQVGLHVSGGTGSFAWVMVVSSP